MLETIQNPGQLKNLTLDQKQALAREIRDRIIQTTLKNGGHLSSNLGAVELTIALHSVLSAPEDKLLFDVGHQCYAHKLLTGRCGRFDTLRRFQGLSGFTRPSESVYDTVASGHASDSISLALGFAKARDIKKENYNVAVVLGDGALTGGMCYEALNDAGQSKTRMLIVLNDNEMSISKNVGSMSRHLTHMRQSGAYRGFKQFLRKVINRLPKGGNRMERFFSRVKDSLKALLVSDMFFDSLDIEYLGPIDGHDISEM
jgi:1-deoxy-D-xylulose-5-phosphate synthase